MASVNNNTNVKSYTGKGFGGLVSGMDTEELVGQLLSGTQAKIDKQTGVKQQTIWRQDAYRDIISMFQSFQSKFFDLLSPKTNLLSASFYSSKIATANSNAIKVSAVNGSINKSLAIDKITSLATARKETSADSVSGDVALKIDGTALLEGSSVSVTLDGITKSIKLSGLEVAGGIKDSSKAILTNLQNSITKAFGNGITINTDTGTISTAKDRQFTINGDSNTQKTLGINGAVSNKVSLTSILKTLNLTTQLVGNKHEFSINGEEFSFSNTTSINEIINKVNGSAAGVKMSYSSLTDKFSIESTTTGAGVAIEMKQTSGNLLTSLFGVSSGSSIASGKINGQVIGSEGPFTGLLTSASIFKVKVNGIEHSIDIVNSDTNTTEDVIQIVNNELEKKFGIGSVKLELKPGTEVGEFEASLITKNGYEAIIDTSGENNLSTLLNFKDGESNILSGTSILKELGFESGSMNVGGKIITYTADETVGSFLTALSSEGVIAEFTDGSFKFSSSNPNTTIQSMDGNGKQLLQQLFGTDNITLNSVSVARKEVDGTNAVISVNGEVIERNTNSFTIDGFQITLLEKTEGPISITAEDNSTQILDGIVAFVDEYNKLQEKINALTSEKTTFRKYPPLSDAQKKDMSEKEITQWEEKAKEGLLSNDPILNGIASSMRTAMYSLPTGTTMALFNIGITTTSSYLEKGKLTIDEEKLKAAIAKDPEGISRLFTDSEKGIAVAMNKIINNAAKSSVASPGSLVQLAGVKNTVSATKNNLTKKMEDIDKTIARLNQRYKMEKDRYWKQFSAMESVINKTNGQSAWLMSQFNQG